MDAMNENPAAVLAAAMRARVWLRALPDGELELSALDTGGRIPPELVEAVRRHKAPLLDLLSPAPPAPEPSAPVSEAPVPEALAAKIPRAKGWADPADGWRIEALAAAAWKVVDVETTGLTPASRKVRVNAKQRGAGADPALRVRVLSATWPGEGGLRTEAWDLDTAGEEPRRRIAAAACSGILIGHNLAFDLSWLFRLVPDADPTAVLDTLLVGRLVRPTLAADLQVLAASDETARDIARRGGGWSLEAMAYLLLGERPDKSLQKPGHWVGPAPLPDGHYQYVTGDATLPLRLLLRMLGADDASDPLIAWRGWLGTVGGKQPDLVDHARVYERLPIHLARMTLRGIPVGRDRLEAYLHKTLTEARAAAKRVAATAPELSDVVVERIADPCKGLDAESRAAIADAFEARGVALSRSEKKGLRRIGEKDLRGARADRGASAPLFQALVAASRATKRAAMAGALRDTVLRGGGFDAAGFGRIRALFSPTTSTGRLSSQEPNGQNFPRDPDFRAIVHAPPGKRIISCDYSALDVRVGAALGIREQRRIAIALGSEPRGTYWYGDGGLSELREAVVDRVHEVDEAAVQAARKGLDEAYRFGKERGRWSAYRAALRRHRIDRLALALRRLLTLYGGGDFDAAWREFSALTAASAGAWLGESAFRRAFRLGVDVHTYTTLKLQGKDPDALAAGLEGEDLRNRFETLKAELGEARQRGKIANLSLLYGMSAPSFRSHAAKVYGIHMSAEEAEDTVNRWLAAYPEIDLLAAGTALRETVFRDGRDGRPYFANSLLGTSSSGVIEIYDPKRGKVRAQPVWYDTTLDRRPICAVGLHAAINYPDQGSGADLLHRVFHVLETEHPDLYDCIVDQIHDEILFEVPEAEAEGYAVRIREVLEREGNRMLGPYGVPMEAGVQVGEVWAH